jgi:hypothetical protein
MLDMDTIGEMGLNPVISLPKLSQSVKSSQYLLLLARLSTARTRTSPLSPIMKVPDFLILLLKPALLFRPFHDSAHSRFSLPKTHGHYPCPAPCDHPRHHARLKVYPQPPAQTLSPNTLKTLRYNSQKLPKLPRLPIPPTSS